MLSNYRKAIRGEDCNLDEMDILLYLINLLDKATGELIFEYCSLVINMRINIDVFRLGPVSVNDVKMTDELLSVLVEQYHYCNIDFVKFVIVDNNKIEHVSIVDFVNGKHYDRSEYFILYNVEHYDTLMW